MDKKRSKGILWRILFFLAAGLAAAVLELGKHTILGWILAAVLWGGYYLIRSRCRDRWKAGKKLLIQAGMLVAFAAILWASWPPVRLIPAVKGSSAGSTGAVHVAQGDLTGMLTEDGQWRLKGYTHTVDKYSLRQASTIQGFGLMWKKDFNWPSLKKKDKKEKK